MVRPVNNNCYTLMRFIEKCKSCFSQFHFNPTISLFVINMVNAKTIFKHMFNTVQRNMGNLIEIQNHKNSNNAKR